VELGGMFGGRRVEECIWGVRRYVWREEGEERIWGVRRYVWREEGGSYGVVLWC